MASEPNATLGLAIASGQVVATIFDTDRPAGGRTRTIELADGTPDAVVAGVGEAVERLVFDAERHGDPTRFECVGASVGGHIDHVNGFVVYASDLIVDGDSWRNEELAADLSRALGVPAFIDNDVNCMVEYERRFGPGADYDSFVVVYLAPDVKGLGSGILVDGKIVRGATGGAGEFGHAVVEAAGPRCGCGNRGCLQAVLTTSTLVRNINWGRRDAVADLADAGDLAERGDARAIQTFQQAGRYFGQGLSLIVNLLNPPLLILGGPEQLLGPVTKPLRPAHRRQPLPRVARKAKRSAALFTQAYKSTLAAYSFCELEQDCRIEVGELTLETAAMGAGLLAATAVRDREPVTA
ncbi:MAG: ROK family protein [Actinomycetota bacterium]|nr:ROK family protein [Actinomycetota bacterium]